MPHKYYLRSRPPGYAHNPAGYTAIETWIPMRPAPEFEEQEIHFYGWVEYDRCLSFEEIWAYELLPADQKERWSYALWVDSGRNVDKAIERYAYLMKVNEMRPDYFTSLNEAWFISLDEQAAKWFIDHITKPTFIE